MWVSNAFDTCAPVSNVSDVASARCAPLAKMIGPSGVFDSGCRRCGGVESCAPLAHEHLALGSPHSDAPTRPNEVNHHHTCNPGSMRHSEIGGVAASMR